MSKLDPTDRSGLLSGAACFKAHIVGSIKTPYVFILPINDLSDDFTIFKFIDPVSIIQVMKRYDTSSLQPAIDQMV